jgi:hypothetical protein
MLEALMQFRHRRLRRDLSAYVDNMLSERARRRLEAHLDSCQACRQELAELRATVEALGSLPMAEAPRSFTLAAAPVAEVRPRPAARRLEFGLRLATATAAFALALVIIGDFAGLPDGGEEEEKWMRGQLFSAEQETPAAMEAAPVETTTLMENAVVQTPAADETPPAPEAVPVETPEPYGITEMPDISEVPGISDVQAEPSVGTGISEEEEYAEKEAMEGTEVEEEAELGEAEAEMEDEANAGEAEAQPAAEEEGGGLSQEEAVRWLEIGLGAGVGILVVIWALARFHRSIGNRP